MSIKSQKDFFAGLMFMGVGGAFAWGATTYNIGTGARMGPGYFPLILGILLAVIGLVITFKAITTYTADGDKWFATARFLYRSGWGTTHLPPRKFLNRRSKSVFRRTRRVALG